MQYAAGIGFDGSFVFAVRSTGIYRKPSCPAKRPAMRQVLFFSTPAEAKRSGFRLYRRCKPNENVKSPQVIMVDRLRIYIENNLDKKLTLSTLSAEAGVSPYHLQRTFKRIVGASPRKCIEGEHVRPIQPHSSSHATEWLGKMENCTVTVGGRRESSNLYTLKNAQTHRRH